MCNRLRIQLCTKIERKQHQKEIVVSRNPLASLIVHSMGENRWRTRKRDSFTVQSRGFSKRTWIDSVRIRPKDRRLPEEVV